MNYDDLARATSGGLFGYSGLQSAAYQAAVMAEAARTAQQAQTAGEMQRLFIQQSRATRQASPPPKRKHVESKVVGTAVIRPPQDIKLLRAGEGL